MIKIKPFKALRPEPDKILAVNSPPYDIVSRNQAAEIIKKNPDSFLKVLKPEAVIPCGQNLSNQKLAEKAAENLEELIEGKKMFFESKPCFYIYQQKYGIEQRTGIVACLSIKDYLNGSIKKHENIRTKIWQERVENIIVTRTHTGCILMVYEDNSVIENIVQKSMIKDKCLYDFVSDDGITNLCWKIDHDDVIISLEKAFREVNNIYIADGHHRTAAAAEAARLEQENNRNEELEDEYLYFPAVLIPKQQIRIMGYHRLIKNLVNFSPDSFLENLNLSFKVEKLSNNQPFLPAQKNTFGMNLSGNWYKLIIKEGIIPKKISKIDQLDVSILQNLVLNPLLDIKDPQNSDKIEFIGGKDSLVQLIEKISLGANIAFTLNPTSIDEVIEVSDNNEIMPPKSTWFEPKLRSGIFVHRF